MITFIKKLLWLHKANILAASETSLDHSAEVIYYRKRTRAAFPIIREMDEDFYLFFLCRSAVSHDIARKSVPSIIHF